MEDILKRIDEKYGAYYKANSVLFNEGDVADKFYILREGLVKIVKSSHDIQTTINTIEAGEIFGEMGLISSQPRNATGITATECFIITLNEETLKNLMKSNNQFTLFLLKAFASKIRYLSSMVKDLTTGNDQVIITTLFVNYLNTIDHQFYFELNLNQVVKNISMESKIPFDIVYDSLEKLQDGEHFTIYNDKIHIKDKKVFIESIPRYF